MHTQIIQVTGRKKNADMTTCIEDSVGNIVMEQEKILDGSHSYINELYDDNEGDITLIETKK